MKLDKDRVEIASDVNNRDGIGIEIYRDNKLKIEIFRDDSEKTRMVTVYENEINIDIPFELVEEAIKTFQNEIPWDFIDDSKIENSEE